MDLTHAEWRKSSRSGGNGGQCVEVACNLPGIVAVRDSKDPAGPALAFTPTRGLRSCMEQGAASSPLGTSPERLIYRRGAGRR
jgi:hypothetical protein